MLCLGLFSPSARAQSAPHDACDTLDQLVTTTPAPPPNRVAWQETLEAIRKADASASVVMIGDSLIRGWPAKQSEAAFPGQVIANLGIGGARTQGVLWLLSDPLVRALHPRQVVLLVTTNLAGGDPSCAIARGIESVIAAIDTEWNSPKLIVYKIPPRGKGFLDLDQDRRQTNQAMEHDEVKSQNVTFVDPSELLMKTAGAYQSDNVHFTSVGYDVLMRSLADAVASPR